MFNDLPGNVKSALGVFGPLIIVIVLFVFVGNFGFGRISSITLSLQKAQKNQTVLTQKLDLLRTVSGSSTDSVNFASVALPENNPSLVVMSQLKKVGSDNQITLASIKAGPEVLDSTGLSRTDITFDAIGFRSQVLSFINSIEAMSPIVLVDKVKLNESSGAVRASLSVKAFWADLPTKLPAITDQVNDLTSDEQKTLQDVSGYIQPQLTQISPSTTTPKSNPFSP